MQDFLNGLNANARAAAGVNATIGRNMGQLGADLREAFVRKRMGDILKDVEQHGGDVTQLDTSAYTDATSLEALGRVTHGVLQSETYKNQIMRNNVQQAKHRYSVFQQYMNDIEGAIKSGDTQRYLGLMSSLSAQSGTPYRFTPSEDGQLNVRFLSPEGWVDNGKMSQIDAYNMLKNYAQNKGRFIRDSVMNSMAVQEENLEQMMKPAVWRSVLDANGNQYTLIPQKIMQGDGLEAGFVVAGPGGMRNMTFEQAAAAGLLNGRGLAAGGADGSVPLPKDAGKRIAEASTVVDPNTGEKRVDPYMSKALTVLTQRTGNVDDAMIALSQWGAALMQDKDVAAKLGAMPDGQRALAIVEIMVSQAQGGTRAEKPSPTPAQGQEGKQNPAHERIRRAAKATNEEMGIGVPVNPLAGVKLGLYDMNK